MLYFIAYNVQVEFTVINFTPFTHVDCFQVWLIRKMSVENGHARLYELKGMNVMATFFGWFTCYPFS